MRNQIERLWNERDQDLPFKSPYEALILASIVEKETGVGADRPLIAAVFVNRLRRGMKLQTDPTVIYGMGANFDGNLRKADLQRDTPYNTYTREGLPPTPIAMPSLASLSATLNPPKSEALYFVARGDGTSHFSTTLEAAQSGSEPLSAERAMIRAPSQGNGVRVNSSLWRGSTVPERQPTWNGSRINCACEARPSW